MAIHSKHHMVNGSGGERVGGMEVGVGECVEVEVGVCGVGGWEMGGRIYGGKGWDSTWSWRCLWMRARVRYTWSRMEVGGGRVCKPVYIELDWKTD